MQILFYTRMALYITAFSIPFFHPGVVVPYDAVTRWIAFILIPGEMLIAFTCVLRGLLSNGDSLQRAD